MADLWHKYRFGIAWTMSNQGEEAKVVRESWPTTARPVHEEAGARAGYVAQRLATRNPVIVADPIEGERYLLVDVDGPEDLERFRAYGLPETLTASSRSDQEEGHLHFIFRPCAGAEMLRVRFEGGVINLGKNGYLVAPPALHPTSGKYHYLNRHAEIAEFPAAAYQQLLQAAGKQDAESLAELESDPEAKIVPGLRHKRMLQLVGALRRYGATEPSALQLLLDFNAQRCSPPKPEAQVRGLVRDGYRRWPEEPDPDFVIPEQGYGLPDQRPELRRPQGPPPQYLNEACFADHFVDTYHDAFLYAAQLKCWLHYRGGYWHTTFAQENARTAVVHLMRNVHLHYPGEGAEARTKFARARGYAAFRSNTLSIAEGELLVHIDSLDQHPELLTVANGTLDLADCSLRESRPRDLLTVGCPTAYVPDAPQKRWIQFIDAITCSDAELALYLQKLLGYCLTGNTDEQKFWIFWGEGGNGKSTLIEVFSRTVGPDIARAVQFSSLVETKHDVPGSAPQPDIARLRTARLVSAGEKKKTRPLDEARIKQLTGKDRVVARTLHSEPIEFVPNFKLIMTVNEKPSITATDEGVRRRVVMVPFLARFEERRLDMDEHLLAEREGVLAWAVEGLRRYQAEGLGTCAAVSEATERYISEMNPVHEFVDCYLELDPEGSVPGKELQGLLDEWNKLNETRRLSSQIFSAGLSMLPGVRRVEDSRKGNYWRGLRLKTAEV